MVVLHKLRVYQELFAVLASALLALLVVRHRALEMPVYAAEDVGADDAPAVDTADADDVPTLARSAGAVASASAAPASPPAPGKERILVLGDSMVEVLAPHLQAYALENGHQFVPAIWYGSTTAAWARSPELGRLLREIDPTMVIVVLGSSELTSRAIESRKPFVRKILDRLGARKIVWVGPPNWRADTGINDLLEDELGADRFFRSEHLELTRKRDGIHPDAAGGRVWMDAIARWLARDSRFGLALRTPTKPAAAPPARVLGSM